jgi:hypothetical protein
MKGRPGFAVLFAVTFWLLTRVFMPGATLEEIAAMYWEMSVSEWHSFASGLKAPFPPTLHTLVNEGRMAELRQALDRGAEVNARSKIEGCTWGCSDDYYEYSFDRTPLHVAVQCRRVDAVALLLQAGASIHARDAGGRTALHYASRGAWQPTGAGSVAVWPDMKGPSYGLSKSCRESYGAGDYAEIIRMLVVAGAQIDAADREGRTVLHIAAARGSAAPDVRALIDAGVSLTARDRRGRTPRDVAVEKSAGDEMIRLLSVSAMGR